MTSKLSQNVLSIKEYKAIILETSSFKKTCSELEHLSSQDKFLPKPLWFKGSRDRGLRDVVAA